MHFIIYHSMAADNLTEQDLRDILEEARTFNSKNNITGCLLYHRKEFLQILEGEKEIISELFNKIKKDPRNNRITNIELKETDGRMYSDWSMAFHKIDNEELNDLKEYLDLDSFNKLHEVKDAPTLSQKLFYYIGKNIIEN
ncbi:MAG: BLUF domain-containing protein [Candidatus Cyclobacteriaceae bacterium M2_1C_046]